jgi:hypothetical protein
MPWVSTPRMFGRFGRRGDMTARLPLARDLEYHFAALYDVEVVDVRGLDEANPPKRLSGGEVAAVMEMVLLTQRQLAAGVQLTLFRGLQATLWENGDAIRLVGRGMSSWTPDRAVAVAHAAKAGRGTVFRTDVHRDRVAMLFDPSSDGEAVLIGDVQAVVTDIL